MLKNQKGFTLIELLIVIVIIGILAGVLIAVINPAQQQNRARDAGVQATMNKVALASEGFISAYGRAPSDTELMGALQNASPYGTTCDQGTDGVCEFTITGNDLITGACGVNGWSGVGTNDCMYHYYGEYGAGATDPTHFRIVARSFGIADTVFLYDNKAGEIVECPASTVADTTGSGCN